MQAKNETDLLLNANQQTKNETTPAVAFNKQIKIRSFEEGFQKVYLKIIKIIKISQFLYLKKKKSKFSNFYHQ